MTESNGKITNVPQRHAPLAPSHEQACLGYLNAVFANAPIIEQKNPHAMAEVQSWARLVCDPLVSRFERGHDTDGET